MERKSLVTQKSLCDFHNGNLFRAREGGRGEERKEGGSEGEGEREEAKRRQRK